MNSSPRVKYLRPVSSAILGLALVLIAGLPSAAAASAPSPGADSNQSATYLRVTNLTSGHVLWIRSGPSMTTQRIGFLRYNDRHIRSYGCKTFRVTWCEVEYRGTRGWVLSV